MGTRRGVRTAVALATAAVAVAAPAHATTEQFDAGQWWIEAMGVTQAHEQVTGEGVVVALLDTPIYAEAPELQGQDVVPSGTRCEQPWSEDDGAPSLPAGPISEVTSHATSMAALIVGNGQGTRADGRGTAGIAPGATLRTYALYDTIGDRGLDCQHGERDDVEFLREVLTADPDIVVVTSEWVGEADIDLQEVVNEGISDGVVFVNSAGNGGPEEAISRFGAVDGVVNAVAGDTEGMAAEFNSVDSRPVDYLTAQDTLTTDPEQAVALAPTAGASGQPTVLVPGVDITAGGFWEGRWESDLMNSGTSASAAFTAGALALVMEKWPDATGNQVLQSMVRHANHPHALGYAAGYGFGGLSLTSMLSEDPTGYPDVHPYYGGLRWAFADDVPPPVMTQRGEGDEAQFWQPTYAEDEQGLPWPLGPGTPATGSASPSSAAPSPEREEASAEAAAPREETAGPPLGWIVVGAVLVAAVVAGALWARARASRTTNVENDNTPVEGPGA
ncbi:S8 family serine peptidase [Georgenia faecalis]|uniref:S8 family serine peptidase n=1 Tax=Georgenia faecalis TaxID=2483799 RepID=A0ABV9D6V3_9MICO|nr:S8 family serine peptidase [Georgenia faecalis]